MFCSKVWHLGKMTLSPKGKNFRKHYNCRLCLTFARITNSFIVCHCCGKYIYGDTKTCQSFLLLGELLSFKYQMKLNFLLIFFDLRILNNPLVSSNSFSRSEFSKWLFNYFACKSFDWVYLVKVIPEARRVDWIRYLHFYCNIKILF